MDYQAGPVSLFASAARNSLILNVVDVKKMSTTEVIRYASNPLNTARAQEYFLGVIRERVDLMERACRALLNAICDCDQCGGLGCVGEHDTGCDQCGGTGLMIASRGMILADAYPLAHDALDGECSVHGGEHA